MSYLARLKAAVSEKCSPEALPELTKAPSVGFVSTPSRHISEITGPDAAPKAEARRQRVIDMLAARPESMRAIYCDAVPVDGLVHIEVGLRYPGGIATCTVEVEAAQYDGILLLDLIQRYSGTVH